MAHRDQASPRGRALLALTLLAATVLSVLSVVRRADAADDIDLLRENGGDPYVMILLDTSASMALTPPAQGSHQSDLGNLAPANGDDPRSKIFQVKQALYEVFSKVENVSFGFAEYNKDHVRVLRKHWLYAPTRSVAFLSNFTYPTAAPTATPSPANDRARLETMWVFGDPVLSSEAGSCAAPIAFSTNDRDNTDILLNRFPKNLAGGQTVRQWISIQNQPYLLEVSLASGAIGDLQIGVRVQLSQVVACSPLATLPMGDETVVFRRVTDFLMVESDLTGLRQDPGVDDDPAPIANDSFLASNCKSNETIAGFFNLQDIAADGTCGASDARPFTGRGAEMNSDSGARPGHADLDRFCWPTDSSGTCYNLRFPTSLDPEFPELDSGDFIPLDWEVDHREEFLRRLNPRHPDRPVENETDLEILRNYFGVASFFQDSADPTAGILRLRNEEEKPIMAFGNSPLARAVSDFRCWYIGGGQKCKNPSSFENGFEALFQLRDDAFKCRIPYLITITDGEENTSGGENASADFNDLDGGSGIRNWIFSFQDTQAVQSLISNTNGELILFSDREDLKTKLEEVIGTITQATRTFATAAVPSVQATVESRIYLTKFQPLNNAGVWEGHLHAFRLPMPQDRTDVPNSAYPNHIWDAAVSMLEQSPERPADGDLSLVSDLKLGPGADQRRVLWGLEKVPGTTGRPGSPAATALFDVTPGPTEPGDPTDPTLPVATTASDLEDDFWTALGLRYEPASGNSVATARGRANRIVTETLVQKMSTVVSTTDDLDQYILGDIFHSNPLVVGAPVNTRYFIDDAEETFDGGVEAGTGYREFFAKHENRRKMLLAGANDGMLHAIEAGVPGVQTENGVDEIRFTAGTGRELFSFVPREVMPTVKLAAENPETHRWSVDGSPAAGDVFIDPIHDGSPASGDREWRTVVITGLREGGSGYFALDVTHPDPLTETQIGPTSEPVATRTVSILPGFPTGDELDPVSEQPTPNGLIVPGCYNAPGGSPGCDDLDFPSLLWEFSDQVWDETLGEWIRLDEDDVDGNGSADGNDFADLAETWSTPDIGRIKVVEGGATVNKYVAIFGGGLDPVKAGTRGNWIYMVDVETGQAIYKRQLEGSAVSDPAAVDTDQDGFLDRIYIGTTAGLLYRIDLVAVDGSGNVVFPRLVSETVTGINDIAYGGVTRIEKGGDPADPLWAPRLILDVVDRPIYFPPAVVFVSELGEYALALGTGDRDDLTSKTGSTGRFFVFVDESAQLADADLPMVEANFEQIDRTEGANPDLLTNPDIAVGRKGWFLVLNDKERLIGDAFAFSGVTFFATFDPRITASCSVKCPSNVTDCTECNKPDTDGVLEPDETPHCTLGGTSRIYLVGTTDADAFLETPSGLSRSFDIEGQFVTSPFTEQAVTSTPNTSPGDGDGGADPEADELSETEIELMEKLQGLFPVRCKFGNHRIDIKVIQANSEIQRIAAVPICIIEKNWKEITE